MPLISFKHRGLFMLLSEIVEKSLVLEESQIRKDAELVKQIQSCFAHLDLYPEDKINEAYNLHTVAANVRFCAERGLNNTRTGRYGLTWAKALIESTTA